MLSKTVAEITAALRGLQEVMAKAMGKKRLEEGQIKNTEAEINQMISTIKEKELGIRQKEVEIQKFRQMIMETKSLIPRKENELKKLKTDYAQIERDSQVERSEIAKLQHELEEAQHVRPVLNNEPDNHHF